MALPDPAETITSGRLTLVPVPLIALDALLAGRTDEATRALGATIPAGFANEERRILQLFRDRLAADPSAARWLFRGIVRRADDVLVGHAGTHLPPADGKVEIGYTVFVPHRRRGYAHEAVAALVAWALAQPEVELVEACIAPDNFASLALVRGLGFVQVGEVVDEQDGPELVFQRAALVGAGPLSRS